MPFLFWGVSGACYVTKYKPKCFRIQSYVIMAGFVGSSFAYYLSVA